MQTCTDNKYYHSHINFRDMQQNNMLKYKRMHTYDLGVLF